MSKGSVDGLKDEAQQRLGGGGKGKVGKDVQNIDNRGGKECGKTHDGVGMRLREARREDELAVQHP